MSVNVATHFITRNHDRASNDQFASSAYRIVSDEKVANEHPTPGTMNRLWQSQPRTRMF